VSRLGRRRFFRASGAASLAFLTGCSTLPFRQAGQRPARVPVVSVLSGGYAQTSAPSLEAFRQGLREYGYQDGQNLLVDAQHAEGQQDRLPELAAAIVNHPVDVIVATGDPAIRAARQATEVLPIVTVAGLGSPVETGIVDSLARPGGNVTGTADLVVQLTPKRLQLLRETQPGATHIHVLGGPSASSFRPSYQAVESAASTLGVGLRLLEVRNRDDLERALDTAADERAEALLVLTSTLTVAHLSWIAEQTAARRIPAMFDRREFALAGGLMIYGPNSLALWLRAAYFVDRILKGTKPGDLPIEQPMRFDFVVNLKTARELGITFPSDIMLQVTEVIE
jgi:putative tryptophan/tyrosine transport system substrate-binding protein